MAYGRDALAALWIRAGGPPTAAREAAAVALAESGGNARATNPRPCGAGAHATGLWQICPLRGRPPQERLYDPLVNAQEAVRIWRSAGNSFARDWAVWRSGAYKKHLGDDDPSFLDRIKALAGGVWSGDEQQVGAAAVGIAGPVVDPVAGAVVSGLVSAVKGLFPAGWLRRGGQVALGGGFVVAGLIFVAKDTGAPKIARSAAKATGAQKAAKVVAKKVPGAGGAVARAVT